MSITTTKDRDYTAIAVLDTTADHSLTSLLLGSGIKTRAFLDMAGLHTALHVGDHVVAAIIIDALSPDPQRILGDLRKAAPNARIVLMYRPTTDRNRIVDRLWTTGACHSVLPMSAPASKICAVFQQALVDALFERMAVQHSDSLKEPANAVEIVRFLQRLTIALAGQGSTGGILRELSLRLPQVIDCSMFAVLLLDQSPARLVTFQASAVDHSLIWEVAQRSCTAITPFKPGSPPLPGELEFQQGPAIAPSPTAHFPHEVLAWPMVVSGESIGSLGVIIAEDHPMRDDYVYALQLVASQLGAALRNVQLAAKLEARAEIDPLTGLHNRQHLPQLLEREWRRAQRYSLQLTLVMIDIDGFERINQIRGHLAGDAVLKRFAALLAEFVRTTDQLVRYGGDRFLLLLPETGATGATLAVERIRVGIKTRPLDAPDSTPIDFSISAGIACYPSERISAAADLLTLCETALGEAKKSGGNRTRVADVNTSGTGGSWAGHVPEQRRKPRVALEVPTTFLPLPDLDVSRLLRLPSINISADGIALRDPTQQLKRQSYGLVFFDDRPDPMLCKVVWVRSSEGEYRAGLHSIRSMDLLSVSEKGARRPRRALIATKDPGHRILVQRVLRSARYDVRVLDVDAPKLDERLVGNSSLVVLSSSALSSPIGMQILRLRQKSSAAVRVIVLNEALDRDQAIDVISASRVEHLISGDESKAELLFTTLTKLVQQDYFGIRRYLLPGADCKRWAVTDPTEKSYALAGVRTVAEEVGCHLRITDLLISAVDEMIISMLYRTQSEKTAGGMKPISVECGSDGRFLCVSVLDEHGLLRMDEIYAGLGIAADHRRNRIQDDAASPHLGFRIMLDALSQVSINIEPGVRTEIIGVVDLRRSLREHRALAPSLGVFGAE